MPDPILDERLNSLLVNLQYVENSHEWLNGMLPYDLTADPATFDTEGKQTLENLRNGLRLSIRREANEKLEAIKQIRCMLDDAEKKADPDAKREATRSAWQEYATLRAESWSIFGECLEFFSGLAVRSRLGQLGVSIYEIADHLVRQCQKDCILQSWYSLTIPAVREALTRTPAALIRLPFPERAIWTLPFAVHEYGRVVIEETVIRYEPVKESLRREDGLLAEQLAITAGDPPAEIGDEELRLAQGHLTTLRCDAFATFYLGLSYACATILLRLSPPFFASRAGSPDDAERAYVILAALHELDESLPAHPFTRPYASLQKTWDAMVAQTRRPSVLEPDRQKLLDGVVSQMSRISKFYLNPASRYGEFWPQASKLLSVWNKNLTDGGSLAVDPVSDLQLRDILNVAWMLRVEAKADEEAKVYEAKLADASLQMCTRLIRPPKPDSATPTAPVVPPRGS